MSDDDAFVFYTLAQSLVFDALPDAVRPGARDSRAPFDCPADAELAVDTLRYLAGTGPDDLRGFINTFEWLHAATMVGAGTPQDPDAAYILELRHRMHSGGVIGERLRDLDNAALIDAIEEAGLRDYLETLATLKHGGRARIILAEERIETDPLGARASLRKLGKGTLSTVLDWEEEGKVPTPHTPEEIAVWSTAWASRKGSTRYAKRILQSVHALTDEPLRTSGQRPDIATIRDALISKPIKRLSPWRQPIPMRALVGPTGKALFIEPCSLSDPDNAYRGWSNNIHRRALALYEMDKLPEFPRVLAADGKPTYGWVRLPAIQFERVASQSVKASLVELPDEVCEVSNAGVLMPPVMAAPAPPPNR